MKCALLILQPCINSALRSKRQNFDLNEALANSPPWPPVKSPAQNYREDDKVLGSGEWVDKVMVNKQEVSRDYNGDLPDMFYQKFLQDSSKIYPEQSCNIFTRSNQLNNSSMDDMDDTDAATSDSSEPDLICQFNQTKLTGITNSVGSKTKKTNPRLAKSSELR